MNKKAISPVVATTLLLVVAVFSIVAFQGWFQNYSSVIYSDNSHQSNNVGSLRIETFTNKQLYLFNGGNHNFSISNIYVNNVSCNISGSYGVGASKINLKVCTSNLTASIENINVITNQGVLSKTVYSILEKPVCSLDGISLAIGTNNTFYLNSSVPYGSSCLNQTRTCSLNNGGTYLTGSYNYSSCTVAPKKDLICTTNFDGDSFISFACASYPQTNTTYKGTLDLNDTNSSIGGSNFCWLNGNKSSCVNNFIIDGCGSGTVFDNSTGLCWERNMGAATSMTYSQAISYCAGLNLGGHTDWYLPSEHQLFTLIDLSRSSPAIVGGSSIFQNIVTNNWYTSYTYNPSGPNSPSLWGVSFGSGMYTARLGGNGLTAVTCVRN